MPIRRAIAFCAFFPAKTLADDRSHINPTHKAAEPPTRTRNILLQRSNISETLLRRCFEARFRDKPPQPRRRNAFRRNRAAHAHTQVAFAL
jgi:hypothetical protein